jgi:hypothetical protein
MPAVAGHPGIRAVTVPDAAPRNCAGAAAEPRVDRPESRSAAGYTDCVAQSSDRMTKPLRASYPRCHPGQVMRPGPAGQAIATAVWICEYPYRTIRLQGPSSDCSDCPVWHGIQQCRRRTDSRQVDEIERLEHQLTA